MLFNLFNVVHHALISQHSGVQMAADEICRWNVECGKPLTEIHSSPFCNKMLLASYCEFLHNTEVHFLLFPINILHLSI